MFIPTYHAHIEFNNHSDPNQPRKREHDATHLDQKHLAEATCALALAVSLLQKHLDAMKNHMPASTTATNNLPPWYHAHIQLNNHSDPNQPRKREHDATHLDQKHHAEATCALALAVSLLQKHLDATKKHMPARTTATYHAHIQLNNHSNPTQPRARCNGCSPQQANATR